MRHRIQGAQRPAKVCDTRRQATDRREALEHRPESRCAVEYTMLLRQLAQGALQAAIRCISS